MKEDRQDGLWGYHNLISVDYNQIQPKVTQFAEFIDPDAKVREYKAPSPRNMKVDYFEIPNNWNASGRTKDLVETISYEPNKSEKDQAILTWVHVINDRSNIRWSNISWSPPESILRFPENTPHRICGCKISHLRVGSNWATPSKYFIEINYSNLVLASSSYEISENDYNNLMAIAKR